MDWDRHQRAVAILSDGEVGKALSEFQEMRGQATTPIDAAVLGLNLATCYSQLGDLDAAFECLTKAKLDLFGADRLIESQIAMSEAALHVLRSEYEIANRQYSTIAEKYQDLLADPQHHDFKKEFLARRAIAMVHCGLNREAATLFKDLFRLEHVEDEQRIRLYFGAALIGIGRFADARQQLSLAAIGDNHELRENALKWINELASRQ